MDVPEIVTSRLSLTPLVASDARALFEYRSDPAVCRFQSFEPGSLEDAERFIGELQLTSFGQPGGWSQLGIRLSESGLLIGDVGIRFPADDLQQAEVGFTLAPKYQGHGYGTEAVTGALGCLFGPLGKHRVVASVDPRNDRSIALLRRVGMRQEAHHRRSLWFKGEWADDLVFALLESEWRSAPVRWPASLDALTAAPDHHQVLLENDQVRVLDTRIAPGEQTPVHTHCWPSVLYVLSGSDFVRCDADGAVLVDSRTTSAAPREGTALWLPALGPHSARNVGHRELRVIAVELKEAL